MKRFPTRIGLVVVLASALFLCSAAVAAEEGHQAAPSKGWVATDTYRVMNFVVLAAVLFFILRKPAGNALSGRIQNIREQLDNLEAEKAAAEKKLSEYETKLMQLEKEAESIVEEYIRQGKEARERILAEAESAAEKMEAQAKKAIENEFATARASLQAEVMERALAEAETLIRNRITEEDQERLVDEYLQKVVAQ
jgi:F-type H+-transporting ATPase subunit b